MDLVKIPTNLKIERRKVEFITESKKRLIGINCKENILEVVMVLMNMAEEYWISKSNRKYGKEKKECIIILLKDIAQGIEEATISRMIETLVNTKNIKKLGFVKKLCLWLKKKFITK